MAVCWAKAELYLRQALNARRARKFSTVSAALSSAFALHPLYTAAHRERGMALLDMHKVEDALEEFEIVLGIFLCVISVTAAATQHRLPLPSLSRVHQVLTPSTAIFRFGCSAASGLSGARCHHHPPPTSPDAKCCKWGSTGAAMSKTWNSRIPMWCAQPA